MKYSNLCSNFKFLINLMKDWFSIVQKYIRLLKDKETRLDHLHKTKEIIQFHQLKRTNLTLHKIRQNHPHQLLLDKLTMVLQPKLILLWTHLQHSIHTTDHLTGLVSMTLDSVMDLVPFACLMRDIKIPAIGLILYSSFHGKQLFT